MIHHLQCSVFAVIGMPGGACGTGGNHLLHAFPCVPFVLAPTRTTPQEKKCFDSADWALAKEGKKAGGDCIIITPAAAAVPDVHVHAACHSASHLKPLSN
jgi:hypothetical protein